MSAFITFVFVNWHISKHLKNNFYRCYIQEPLINSWMTSMRLKTTKLPRPAIAPCLRPCRQLPRGLHGCRSGAIAGRGSFANLGNSPAIPCGLRLAFVVFRHLAVHPELISGSFKMNNIKTLIICHNAAIKSRFNPRFNLLCARQHDKQTGL